MLSVVVVVVAVLFMIPPFWGNQGHVQGFVTPVFRPVWDAMGEILESGWDAGGQVVVTLKGEIVVDVWSGGMQGESLAAVFSSSKVVESLAIAMLEDRGHIDYDAPIATYWPEFGVHGKGAITVKDWMAHRGRIPAFPSEIDLEWVKEVIETESMDSFIANLTPTDLAPGTSQYHGITRGFVVDALVRRTDPSKRPLSQFVREDIVLPTRDRYKETEFYLGRVPQSALDRMVTHVGLGARTVLGYVLPQKFLPAWIIEALMPADQVLTEADQNAMSKLIREPTGLFARSLTMSRNSTTFRGASEVANDPLFRQLPLSSASGISNARSLARIGGLLAQGGGPLLTRKGLTRAMNATPQFDELLHLDLQMTACGWGLDRIPIRGMPGWVGWFGSGGSALLFHPRHELSFAYVPLYLAPKVSKPRAEKLMRLTARLFNKYF